jgi:hypothetical protein
MEHQETEVQTEEISSVELPIKSVGDVFLSTIELFYNSPELMQKCYYDIVRISIKYPPQKNENKFIYGKLIERVLIRTFQQIGIDIVDLDESHTMGSEYKNDIRMFDIDISIKAKLNKGGNIILINKKSTSEHLIKIQTIVCIINERKLYFIPSDIVDNELYVIQDAGCISYKGTLITMMNKKYKQYIYEFPELNDEYKNKLTTVTQIDIYSMLLKELDNLNNFI